MENSDNFIGGDYGKYDDGNLFNLKQVQLDDEVILGISMDIEKNKEDEKRKKILIQLNLEI